MSRRTTKQRRAAVARRWVRRHTFIVTGTGQRLLPGLAFLSALLPAAVTPSRLFGQGWRHDMTRHALVR